MYKEIYRWFLFYFCRLLFKNVPLRFGITIIIYYCINDPVQCWYRRLFVTWYLIIFFVHHPIHQLGEYIMHIKCCLCWKFTWYCVISVYQGVDGWRKCRQKYIMGSLSIVFAWQFSTVLFGASGWQLRCGPVKSTAIILFQMPPLLMLWCYIMLCQKIMK